MKPVIEVKNLSKRYEIFHERASYYSLRDEIMSVLSGTRARREQFWALRDVAFEVQRGEVLGIIGPNGAGKSTLLKILSRITPPTHGSAILRGRVGSLLEVGTGFHPELSGRENIFLNGAILGMTRKEITKKFDEIVDFSGIEKFLDTPVKYYSSGMYVRLAFAVAAHMDPEILVIDEVLAVGDAEFQKKCLGKMDKITKEQGRTILFVSHNMIAVQQLCERVILLEKGGITTLGPVKEVITDYINNLISTGNPEIAFETDQSKDITFTKVWITDISGKKSNIIDVDSDFSIWIEWNVQKPAHNVEISIFLKNSLGTNLTFTNLSDSLGNKLLSFQPGRYVANVLFHKNFFVPDNYFISLSSHIPSVKTIDGKPDILGFTIRENGTSPMTRYGEGGKYWGAVFSNARWNIERK